jgi:predicted RNA-binding Zn ribbon-like protein
MADFNHPEFQLVGGSLCLDLINTLDNRSDAARIKELIPSCRELLAFAVQSKVIAHKTAETLAQHAEQNPKQAAKANQELIRLRECVHRIFRQIVNSSSPREQDLGELSSFLQNALGHLQLRQQNGTVTLDWPEQETNLNFLQWHAAKSAADLLTSSDVQWVRLCECDWFFVDRSRNHSRRWCDMKVCGNREKVRRFYARARRK